MHTTPDAAEKAAREPVRRRRAPFASLRLRLMFLALLAILPVLGLMIFNHSEERQKASTEAKKSALQLAQIAASDEAQLVEATRQLLVVLAQIPSVQNLDATSCSLFLTDLLKQLPLYQNLVAATPDGNVFCSAVPYDAPTNVADRPAFQGAVRTRGFAVSDYIISLITGKPSLSFAYPVLDDAQGVRALVAATLDLTWLDEFVARVQLPEGSTLSVVDQAGVILARYPDPERWRGQSVEMPATQPFLAEGEWVYEADGVDGVPRFYGLARLCCVSAGSVYVRVGISKAVVFAEANRTLQRNLIALGAVTLLAFALAGVGGQLSVLRPVNAILDAVKRVDAGDLSARVGQNFGGGALGHLAESFDRAAENLEKREADIRRAHQALQIYTAHTEALAREAGRLGSHLDLAGVLDAICQGATSLLSVRAASVSLCDETCDALHNVSDCGLSVEFRNQTQPLLRSTYENYNGDGSSVVVLRTDVHPELPDASLCAALNICQIVSAPMMRDGQLVGVLNLYTFGKERPFSEDELNHLAAFADQATLAITNARLYESLRREERARADLLRGLISAQEDERKRIARELHDDTSQELGALMVELESADLAQAAGKAHDGQHLQSAKSIARRLMMDIRRLVSDLRPALLDDLGLVPAIAWYGEKRLEAVGIEVVMKCDPEEIRLPQSVEITLFRIAQEAISNIVKHSGASRVAIRLRSSDQRVTLTIEDNGHGFEVSSGDTSKASASGFGLQGIRERVSILGGEFRLRSTPGQGTVVEVSDPLK